MSASPDDPKKAATQRWHIDHQIPIAVIVTLILQTASGVWFFAQLSSKVDRALDALAEFKAERYTKADAAKDREFFLAIMQSAQARDVELERRVTALEGRVHR